MTLLYPHYVVCIAETGWNSFRARKSQATFVSDAVARLLSHVKDVAVRAQAPLGEPHIGLEKTSGNQGKPGEP